MRRRPFLGALLPAALAGPPQALAATTDSTRGPSGASAAGGLPMSESPAANPPLGISHRPLRFPADHGSHPDTHTEWWYVTGWLRAGAGARPGDAPDTGFQVTFFRSRTGFGEGSASRFAPRQLVFAHVALTDLAGDPQDGTLHDQRVAREGFGLASTPGAAPPQAVRLLDWTLERLAPVGPGDARSQLRVVVRAERFALQLDLAGTQPLLLQGEAGFSRKGPDPDEASHYYSEPQLAVTGRVQRAGAPAREVSGRAWLDHEWSDQYLGQGAVGWDWVGFNLHDGAALMAFRLRRADGAVVWTGGSYRDANGALRVFSADEVRFEGQRLWTSPRTQAAYPVECVLVTPAGRWRVVALKDDQELDSRGSTGAVYWEGLSALKTLTGAVVGYGYLELTGYAGRLRL